MTLAGDVAGLRGCPAGVRDGSVMSCPAGSVLRTAGRLLGRGLAFRWPARSGGLRGGDGDDVAGVEFPELPHQVVLPGIGGLWAAPRFPDR